MKERWCFEVERVRLSALIMGSWGFGATKRGNNGRLGSVSDYCARHCICPVIVVRHPDGDHPVVAVASSAGEDEEEPASHDASKDQKGLTCENRQICSRCGSNSSIQLSPSTF